MTYKWHYYQQRLVAHFQPQQAVARDEFEHCLAALNPCLEHVIADIKPAHYLHEVGLVDHFEHNIFEQW